MDTFDKNTRFALLLQHDGEVLRDVAWTSINYHKLHESNFVVIYRGDKLVVWKDRYDFGPRGATITRPHMERLKKMYEEQEKEFK